MMDITAALILCAGQGKRMGELTHDLPKPLLEFLPGVTFLEYQIAYCLWHGIENLFINIHYQGSKIKNFIAQKYPKLKIVFLEEPELFEVGGSILYCLDSFEKNFLKKEDYLLAINSDILHPSFLPSLFFPCAGTEALLFSFRVPSRLLEESICNLLEIDEQGFLKKIISSNEHDLLAQQESSVTFAGLSLIPCNLPFSFKGKEGIFERIANFSKEKIKILPLRGEFESIDLGTYNLWKQRNFQKNTSFMNFWQEIKEILKQFRQ